MSRVRDWLRSHHHQRFRVLFGLLIGALVAAPLLHAFGMPGFGLEGFLLASLLWAGLGGLARNRGTAIVVLVVLFGASRVVHGAGVGGGTAVATASDIFLVCAAGLAGVAALREALRGGSVTAERLYAASSVYLLAGLAFALVYHGLSRIVPGAIQATAAPGQPIDFETAVYFSFVTLATLGYGDVVPATPFARSLAICEAVGAQLFVAVLIARLVSLQSRSQD